MAKPRVEQLRGVLGNSGSVELSGSLTIKQDSTTHSALIVSGSAEIMDTIINNAIVSASLSIQNLGKLGDNGVIDCGNFF